MLFGMSGLGKTYVSQMLRAGGGWFHYSVDYRIGTRYMGEHIADNFKREAMKVPLLSELLRKDSVTIQSNITFANLAPLSTYLAKPGDPAKGGLEFDEYMRRQEQHRQAEVSATLDTVHFIERAKLLYGYDDFICDTSGSICEVVDADNPDDPVLTALADHVLMVWIEGSDDHTDELIRRFEADPKPMCYQIPFLRAVWADFLKDSGAAPDAVDPDEFSRFAFARALKNRQPRYRAMAENWGVTIAAADVAAVKTPDDMIDLIARALERD